MYRQKSTFRQLFDGLQIRNQFHTPVRGAVSIQKVFIELSEITTPYLISFQVSDGDAFTALVAQPIFPTADMRRLT